MSRPAVPQQPLLTFPDAERSPLSIRAKALVFVDPRSRELRKEVERLAIRPAPVLIQGETGSGKELLARHIHNASERSGLFVALSCSGLGARTAQAELFGYVTAGQESTVAGRAGWFGSANGGTLYLDEIGDLSLGLQEQLLQALETGEVLRVGANRATPVDVRVVAATSIDLAQAVAAGKFSERLYQYLGDGLLSLPPLRERVGDILPMAEYFLGIHAQRLGLAFPIIGERAQRTLEAYSWPGNTRELENIIHFALLVSTGDEIEPRHLNLPGIGDPLALLESGFRQALAVDDASLRERLGRWLREASQRLEG